VAAEGESLRSIVCVVVEMKVQVCGDGLTQGPPGRLIDRPSARPAHRPTWCYGVFPRRKRALDAGVVSGGRSPSQGVGVGARKSSWPARNPVRATNKQGAAGLAGDMEHHRCPIWRAGLSTNDWTALVDEPGLGRPAVGACWTKGSGQRCGGGHLEEAGQ